MDAGKLTSNDFGHAYEYALGDALYREICGFGLARIEDNDAYETVRRAWLQLSEEQRGVYAMSASSAVGVLLDMEPLLTERDVDELVLEFQGDDAGKKGDVRDLILRRDGVCWEIGLSIKHNHEAVKHCRLSYCLDFGAVWYDVPCSDLYWRDVNPIFDRLKAERERKARWSSIPDKESRVYVPILQAFINEIKRAYARDPAIIVRMFQFLLGKKDFYKIVSEDNKQVTLIRTFNFNRTLNRPSARRISEIVVPTTAIPTELIDVRFKPGRKTTLEMILKNGWQLNLRIHSAKSQVEPSLKFGVQYEDIPASVLTFECMWNVAGR